MSEHPTPPSQPKIAQRLAIRTLLLVIVLGSLYLGYQKWHDVSQDITAVKPADTVGYLAAIQIQDNGQQAVAFGPDGKMVASKAWHPGVTDRDITWNPSGNRVFFVSDREENNFHIFRWDPTDNSEPIRRTIGSRSRGEPQFDRENTEDSDKTALITSGGFVLEYQPKDMSTRQILPPLGKETTKSSDDEGGGSQGQFSGAYSEIGNSFKIARWCKGGNWIASVMRRDQGEVLVMQNLTPTKEGKLPRPIPITAGDTVNFDVNPKDGSIVYTVQNFQWPLPQMIPPQFQKGNKVTRPFANLMGHIDPDKDPEAPIGASIDDSGAFGAPKISPDGTTVLCTVGPVDPNSGFNPKALVACPIQPQGLGSAARIAVGEIYEPCWNATGDLVAFAKRENGKRALYTMHKDGSSIINLTGNTGNFSFPVFSQQVKTAPATSN